MPRTTLMKEDFIKSQIADSSLRMRPLRVLEVFPGSFLDNETANWAFQSQFLKQTPGVTFGQIHDREVIHAGTPGIEAFTAIMAISFAFDNFYDTIIFHNLHKSTSEYALGEIHPETMVFIKYMAWFHQTIRIGHNLVVDFRHKEVECPTHIVANNIAKTQRSP